MPLHHGAGECFDARGARILKTPTRLWTMTAKTLLVVRPWVQRYLAGWAERASTIPDPELRSQALASIRTKAFHCEGGAVYGLLAGMRHPEVIRFIVAYQTISDYLDNLCDRSTSLDPDDFRSLHDAMLQALIPDAPHGRYYRLREEQDDGGYLDALVATCQEVLRTTPAYPAIAEPIRELAGYYCDLQVHKHVRPEERISRLQDWFHKYRDGLPPMSWYEFSACAGSTLGIFCLVAHAFHGQCTPALARKVKEAYFPWVQGLHILLDYLIDQEEDRTAGDLNFCCFYPDGDTMTERLVHFFRQADKSIAPLPDAAFYRMVNHGLLGIYLADRKVNRQRQVRETAKKMIQTGGATALFFFIHCWLYRRLGILYG